ncbi:MAG TPA: heme-binding protein [Candidatus Binatia bacterium]|nr:heme-binding protein [Candidatus Binatia bacterium]
MSTMSRFSAGLFALTLVAVAAPSDIHAQGLITTQKLSAALANELVGQAVAACAQKGIAVVAVVVDLDGVRQAVLRGDGAPIHSVDNAYYKAYSAASLTLSRKEESTKQVADRIAKNPPSNVPQTHLPNISYSQGGLTLMAGGKAIGALGVSGAPGGNIDEECGRAALEKIRERMK